MDTQTEEDFVPTIFESEVYHDLYHVFLLVVDSSPNYLFFLRLGVHGEMEWRHGEML